MHIRPMESRDDDAVLQLVQSSLTAAGLAVHGTAYYDPQLGRLAEYYASLDHARYWVIVDEGQVRAGAGIAPVAGTHGICELQKLYVAASHRRRGYASRLLDTALAFADQYYDQCYLETHTKLHAARILYAKYGFTPLEQPLSGGEHTAMDRWFIRDLDGHVRRSIQEIQISPTKH